MEFKEDDVPGLVGLSAFLAQPPLTDLPVPRNIKGVPWAKADANLCRHSLDLVTLLLNVLKTPHVGAGQSTIHSLVNSLTVEVFTRLLSIHDGSLSTSLGRDVCDGSHTTVVNMRPDVLFMVKHVLLVRGEEESDAFEKAVQDLTRKAVYNPVLAMVPYTFAFACTKQHLQFFALSFRSVFAVLFLSPFCIVFTRCVQ